MATMTIKTWYPETIYRGSAGETVSTYTDSVEEPGYLDDGNLYEGLAAIADYVSEGRKFNVKFRP